MPPEEETSAFQGYVDQAIAMAIEHGPRILLAIALLIGGFWFIGKVVKTTEKRLNKGKVEPSVSSFLTSFISAALKVMVVIMVASMFGVETTSFVAVIGAATLAVGMALQGSLANFAGGILILVFKPFKVGDIIGAQGFEGMVGEIQVFKTSIIGVDQKVHIIPNGLLSNGTISNYSAKGVLRVNMKAWVGYDCDIELAKKVALEVLEAHPMVVDKPHPRTRVFQLEKDAVVLGIHPYTDVMLVWDVYFDIQEQLVLAFQKHGISIPHNKVDVHHNPSEDPTLKSITS